MVVGLNLSGGGKSVKIVEAPPGGSPSLKLGQNGGSVREVYSRYGPGVVSVDVASSKLGPAGGSGFVLDKSGYIVTNQHVLSGADSVSVLFPDGRREAAKVVGEDPSTDVGVVKVDAPEKVLDPLTLGDSSAVKVGSPVIAMGNPLNVGLSVTTGIVSGIQRPIQAPNDYTIDGALQTDAAISSGNSGGPLLDSRGAVIGINSQVASTNGQDVAQGVGFAVPIDTVKTVVKQLIEKGSVEHGYIGVRMFPAGIDELSAYLGLSKDDLKSRYGLPPEGAIVSGTTPGGPAAKAGIKSGKTEDIKGVPVVLGDVITSVDGKKVSSPDDVISVVNKKSPGEKMELTVQTPGKEPRKVEVEVAAQPAERN